MNVCMNHKRNCHYYYYYYYYYYGFVLEEMRNEKGETKIKMFNFAHWSYKLTEKDFFVSLTN